MPPGLPFVRSKVCLWQAKDLTNRRSGGARIVITVGIVLHNEMGAAHAFALEDCTTVGVFFFFRLRPAELPRNQVGSIWQVDDVVPVGMVV